MCVCVCVCVCVYEVNVSVDVWVGVSEVITSIYNSIGIKPQAAVPGSPIAKSKLPPNKH